MGQDIEDGEQSYLPVFLSIFLEDINEEVTRYMSALREN